MIGKRNPQTSIYDVGALNAIELKPGSFYAQLQARAATLFPEELFRSMYAAGGRPSVPPSQLALLVVLQNYTKVSDQEAVDRSAYDARWAVVLGLPLGEALCVKSTLQLFRAKLVLHQKTRVLLQGSISEARRLGQLPKGELCVAVDTLCIRGAGAVKDTWNLLATGIWQVVQAAAKALSETPADWAARHGLSDYVPDRNSSVKGALDLDWSDAAAREAALAVIVAAAVAAYQQADVLAAVLPAAAAQRVREAQTLLGELVLQDVEVQRPEGGAPQVAIKAGTAPDRIPSATDEEQRHGHKSRANKFTGHKARTVVEVESGLILDTEILPGNAGDASEVVAQVERTAAEQAVNIDQVQGDCAFGSGQTRQEFAEQGIALAAKVPAEPDRGLFPKSRFAFDLQAGSATCPAGKTTADYRETLGGGRIYRFGRACDGCPLQSQCTTSAQGRTVQQHAQEALLQAARAAAATPEGRQGLRQRVIVEHRQAQLARLGVKQARYCGREKTLLQAVAAATVVNLRLIWNRTDALAARAGSDPNPPAPAAGGHHGPVGTVWEPETGLLGRLSGPFRIQVARRPPRWLWAERVPVCLRDTLVAA